MMRLHQINYSVQSNLEIHQHENAKSWSDLVFSACPSHLFAWGLFSLILVRKSSSLIKVFTFPSELLLSSLIDRSINNENISATGAKLRNTSSAFASWRQWCSVASWLGERLAHHCFERKLRCWRESSFMILEPITGIGDGGLIGPEPKHYMCSQSYLSETRSRSLIDKSSRPTQWYLKLLIKWSSA